MGWLGLGPASLARRARRGAPPAISATAAPALGALADGDQVQSGLSAGALDAANYASTDGAIASVVAAVTIDGAAGALADTVSAGATVSVVITVADEAGNSRAFLAGVRVVAGVAPGLAASQSLSGRVLSITVDSLTGAPAPATALTALTLDGASVLGDQTGTDPWDYAVPDAAAAQSVAWQVVASNFEGTATASGSQSVPANLFAPAPATSPAITGTVAPGTTVTLDQGTYTGTTPITVTPTLTLDGVEVTGSIYNGDQFDIPTGTDGQSLVYSETASNGIAPDATQGASATVTAASFLLDLYPGALAAYSMRRLSSSVAQVVEVRRSGDGAEASFTPEEVEDGTLAAFCGSGDGFAVRFYDQSGNDNHAFQNTAGKQPKVVSGGSLTTLNAKPAPLYTEANESQMVLPAGVHSLAGSSDKTLITVATADSGGAGFYRTVYIGQGGSSKVTFRFSDGGSSVLTFNGFSNTVGFPMSIDQPYIAWSHDISGAQEVFLNGSKVAGNAGGGTNSAGEARLGGYLDSNFWNGPIAEVIMYPSDKSTDRGAIEAELSAFYGIAV